MKRAAVLSLLILAGCAAEPRDPAIRYVVTTPEQIVAVACAWDRPNCRSVIGLAFMAEPCTVYVPPYSARTAFIWKHEERHCREGHFHAEEASHVQARR